MKFQIGEYIPILGIGATLIVSVLSLILSLKNTKKTLFINSITASRIKWMDTIRGNISEFCGLTHHYSLSNLTDLEKKPIIEKIDRLRFLIKLQLNPTDDYDSRIIAKIESIPNLTDSRKIDELVQELNELVQLTQNLLKLEWEGAKEESKHGNLSLKRKSKLKGKYLPHNQ